MRLSTVNGPHSSEQPPPPSTLKELPDLAEALTHLRYQNNILLGDPKFDIQAHNPLSQQVAELLMEFGLVDFRHHLDRYGGSDTGNVVSDMGWKIFGREVGKRRHGGNKSHEEAYRALCPES